jgi:flagellar biosynthetic protein FliO
MWKLAFLFALPVAAAESQALGAAAPSLTASVVRMLGGLVFVIALFFGAAWLFRNGVRFRSANGVPRKLHILEARSLGPRQAVYVVGYENQRLLVGSTANGLSLLTQLPDAPDVAPESAPTDRIVPVSFGEALMHALGRK